MCCSMKCNAYVHKKWVYLLALSLLPLVVYPLNEMRDFAYRGAMIVVWFQK
jgi:hypothetical protein